MAKFQLKRSLTVAGWNASSIVLDVGEPGVAIDTGEIRTGNGVNVWSALPSPAVSPTVLALKAPLASPTFTGTVSGITKLNGTVVTTVANQAQERPVNSKIENRIVDPAQGTYSIAGTGVRGTVQQGSATVDAYGSVIAVAGDANVLGSASPDNEFAALFGAVRMGTAAKPVQGRVWVADTGGHGPIGQRADLLTGITSFINNYHNSEPNDGPSAAFIAATKVGAGPASGGTDHALAPTYTNGYGFAVVGKCTGSAPGWKVGFRAGGYASGWMTSSDTTVLEKGVEVTDYTVSGIHVHAPSNPVAPAAVFEGPVLVQARDVAADLSSIETSVAAITADPTNAVTSVWIPAKEFDLASGTASYAVTAGRLAGWSLDAAVQSYVTAFIRVPSHWATMWIDHVWANLAANAGNVSLTGERSEQADGDSFNVAPTGSSIITAANPVIYAVKVSPMTAAVAVTPSKFITLRIGRNGASANDTLPNNSLLLGVQLRKAS